MAVTVLIASVFVTLPAMAQKAVATVPHLLTMQDELGKPGNAVYAAGSLGPQAAGPLEHTFVLANTTDTPLTLDHLEPSCACTTASVVGGTDGMAPVVIAPRQTLSVRVSVDPLQLLPGLLHKSVWVFVQGQAAPAATLEMTGALLPAVTFSPPSLSFGRIERGTVLTLLLKATPRPERLEQGSELRLVSPDPDIQVSAVTPDTPVEHSFRVRLVPHAHIGRLQGKLSLVLVPLGAAAGAAGPVVETVSWRAEAEGDVSAVPSVVGFGVPAAGQAVTRKVRLSGKGIGPNGQVLTISSSSPYLSAAFLPLPRAVDPTRSPNLVEMELRLDPRVPVGPFEAHLTVTTQSGEQLILPVYAVVQPTATVGDKP